MSTIHYDVPQHPRERKRERENEKSKSELAKEEEIVVIVARRTVAGRRVFLFASPKLLYLFSFFSFLKQASIASFWSLQMPQNLAYGCSEWQSLRAAASCFLSFDDDVGQSMGNNQKLETTLCRSAARACSHSRLSDQLSEQGSSRVSHAPQRSGIPCG